MRHSDFGKGLGLDFRQNGVVGVSGFVAPGNWTEVDVEMADVFGRVEFSGIVDGMVVDADPEGADVEHGNFVASEQMLVHDVGKLGENLDDHTAPGGAIFHDFIDDFVFTDSFALDGAGIVALAVVGFF